MEGPYVESEAGRSQSQLTTGVSEQFQVNTRVTVQQPWVESETGRSQPSQLVVGVYESRPSGRFNCARISGSSCMKNPITPFYAIAGEL